MKLTRAISLTCVLTAFSLTAVSCLPAGIETGLSSIVSTDVIEKQTLINSINVSGTVEGGSLVKITTTLHQKVKTLNVEIGSYVEEGDVLCVFDSTELQAQYDELMRTIENSEAMKEKSKEISQRNLENAKTEKSVMLAQAQRTIDDAVKARDDAYNRYNRLVDELNALILSEHDLYQSVLNAADEFERAQCEARYQEAQMRKQSIETELGMIESQFSTYDSAVESAKEAYESVKRNADASIQSLQDSIDLEQFDADDSFASQLEQLKESIEECTVKAPRCGIITALNVAEGSIPTTESIMTIEDDEQLKITVQISEADILSISEGQDVIVKTTATGEEEFEGSVSRVVNIFSAADPYSGEQGGYTAEITIDEKETGLLIGMNAKAKIILEKAEDVLAVPYDAITENEEGESVIYIARMGEDGSYTAQSVQIEIGLESDYYTEIISSGIEEGDIVILDPLYMNEGAAVQISDEAISE